MNIRRTPIQDLINRAIAARLWFRERCPGDLHQGREFSPAELRTEIQNRPDLEYLADPTSWVLYDPQPQADRWQIGIREQRIQQDADVNALLKRIEAGWR